MSMEIRGFVPGFWEDKEPWRVVEGKLAFKNEEHELVLLSGDNHKPLTGKDLENHEKTAKILERLNTHHRSGFTDKENELIVQKQIIIINKKSASSTGVSKAAKSALPKTPEARPKQAAPASRNAVREAFLNKAKLLKMHTECCNALKTKEALCDSTEKAAKAINAFINKNEYTRFMARPARDDKDQLVPDQFIVTIASKKGRIQDKNRGFVIAETRLSTGTLHKLLTNKNVPEEGIYDAVNFKIKGSKEADLEKIWE